MALRRLAIVGSISTPISRLASPNPHVISTRRPISDFLRRHHFSASTDESASKVASINPGRLSRTIRPVLSGFVLFLLTIVLCTATVCEIASNDNGDLAHNHS